MEQALLLTRCGCRGLDQRIALPRDSYLQGYFDDLYDKLRVGPPLYFVVEDINVTRNSPDVDAICSVAGCDDDSFVNRVSRNCVGAAVHAVVMLLYSCLLLAGACSGRCPLLASVCAGQQRSTQPQHKLAGRAPSLLAGRLPVLDQPFLAPVLPGLPPRGPGRPGVRALPAPRPASLHIPGEPLRQLLRLLRAWAPPSARRVGGRAAIA